ncbi:hypothetical protein H6G76_29255 [Nostoc sp. FACHB-152]|uniref:hypothetical protein n=1 Tax=unclassified Nostoc TaxID=2593658 RepID=UPI001684BB3C|nr:MULTISPECIES: hypothetical protein [unclassified Nostoc]MBD2451146.1 hypothetical protein [Nostoc sp. FACHB-152]MBD2472911.1 hypothetical protein [Nostoc sp. FACHB-145]
MMKPEVSSRQLQKYLNIARLYIPGFENFTDPKTNGLNGYAKLNRSHIRVLQEIRSLARTQTLADIEQQYKQKRLPGRV